METTFAPQYANIFMHKFEQDLLTAQDLQPTLYTRYIDDIFCLWTHGEESLKRLHGDINKFHPTVRLTMDYSPKSVAFLDTLISIKDGHLSTSLYREPTDNLTMLHFSSFHPKHIKEAIPYGQALRIHRICSDEEERNRHLQTLKDALVRTGYAARLIDRQFQRATARNRTDLLRRQTWDTTDRIPFVVQYFPGAEKLRHLLHSLQHVIDEDEHLAKVIPTPPLLAFKQSREILNNLQEVNKEIESMLKNGIIEVGCSQWSSPIVMVPKPDGTQRLCVDCRKVNAFTRTDSYPIPRLEDCIEKVGQSAFISKLDLLKRLLAGTFIRKGKGDFSFCDSRWYIPIQSSAIWHEKRPATFQRLTNKVVSGLPNCAV
ncbi:uncharacterized protein [Scyliorhinus torazame]|uniref:uncharacterized protein isoform X3 n=1 Tax=Scyliorhinus torazame TaxID=75743 RepID=UPI003B5C9F1A